MNINNGGFLHDFFNREELKYKQMIEDLSNDIIMANSNEDIIENILSKKSYDVIEISDELIDKRDVIEKEIDNPYYHFDYGRTLDKIKGLHIKFEHELSGSCELLKYRASRSLLWSPDNIQLIGNSLLLFYESPYKENMDDVYDSIFRQYNEDVRRIKELISGCNGDIKEFNKSLINKLDSKISEKRNRISKLYELSKKMAIPISKREDAPLFTPIKIEKKIKELSTKVNCEEEYYIPEEHYKEILKILRQCGSSMEKIPDTYIQMGEEKLRNIFVSHLNVTFEGQAQAECFRNKGKTDICIEYNNRAAFIAECKIWKGINTIQNTINQLLGYTTWKDTKLSIIIFNKNNKDFFSLINTFEENIINVENYYRHNKIGMNEFELLLNSDNKGQYIKIRIFIFNLFTKK